MLLTMAVGVSAHSVHEDTNSNQEIVVKTVKINDSVYMLQGRGGNIGVSVGKDGILMIDDDYANVYPKLAEALKALGTEKPKFVFNTHWHGDHTEGNKFFGKDSIIISHFNVRSRLETESTVFGRKVAAYPAFALPVITYDTSMMVHFNDEQVKAVHFPNSHTDGDSVIFFAKSNVVHMGDTFFRAGFPFVDLENGGSVQGLTGNIAKIITMLPSDVKIIPGHGQLSNLDDLKNYHQMLVETTAFVEKGLKEKKTIDQLKKEGFPEKYKSWGSGFINSDLWMETIVKSLAKK
jgi:cyclase